MANEEITVAEAARKLTVSLAYVYSLVWAGKLEARKVGKKWLISAQAIDTRQEARNK